MLVSIEDNEIVADLIGVSNLLVYPVNNRFNIQLDIRNKEGVFITDAKVFVSGKEAKYKQDAKTYWLKQKKLKEAFLKVYAPADTLLMQIELDRSYDVPVWKQRWKIFKITKVGKAATWAPVKIASLFKKKQGYKPQPGLGQGYVLLNQPKYKLTDTVKLKAYLVNKKLNRYKGKLDVFLEYTAKNKFNKQLLTRLSPTSHGSYIYSFALSDTLVSDIRYSIVFRNKDDKSIISKTFSTEDYVLDEIGTYKFRSANEKYYPGDTMVFYASAKDANGLALLDGSVKLVVTADNILNFYKDTMYVADTLWAEDKVLATEDETIFKLPVSKLPFAHLNIKAALTFKNSNNELHEESETIEYEPNARDLEVIVKKDSVFAVYRVNGKSVEGKGTVDISGDILDRVLNINYPAKLKIDPLANACYFSLIRGGDTLKESADINTSYSLNLSRISKGDTLGFVLYNPYKIPVNYIVLSGSNVIGSGKEDGAEINWQNVVFNKHKMYVVKWQYMWGGELREGHENLALLYKLLKINIENNSTVFPGQTDSVTVEVTDYKNRPASGVNLAAVAYNSQFKKDIIVREPPYLVNYKNRTSIIRGTYEIDEPYITKRYSLGDYTKWINRFGVDSMLYYKILFPSKIPLDIVSPIRDFIPQLSVHVVKRGKPQEIYLLYVNRQLVYYNGVTDKMKYAFPSMQGYTQIAFRLRDRYIEIDSIYTQPFYKHDLIIDLDNLPVKTFVKEMPVYFTPDERNLLENSIWQLDNNYRTGNGYIWQESKVVKLNGYQSHLAGPFVKNQEIHFFAPADFDISFPFEPGYQYNLSKQISRLEKKTIFDKDIKKTELRKVIKPLLVLGDTLIEPPVIRYNAIVRTPYINLTYHNNYSYLLSTGSLQFTVSADTSVSLKYVILYTDTANIVLNGSVRNIKNIKPGKYSLLLINKDFSTIQIDNIVISTGETFCIHTEAYKFVSDNQVVQELIKKSMAPLPVPVVDVPAKPIPPVVYINIPKGNSSIIGKVTDALGGNSVSGATINIKGSGTGVSTSPDGSFQINNIKEGSYILVVSLVGYNSQEKQVILREGETSTIDIKMTVSSNSLEEVVVTGYGIQSRANMTGSVAVISSKELSDNLNSYTGNLQGRVAGLSVEGTPGSSRNIMIRGAATLSGDNKPIYVIDGIIYNEMPGNIKPEMIASMEVLKDAAATAIYGARGANGVILISTGAKKVRSIFRDYALWQPELTTNAHGKATFNVTYPDNITGWEMYVLGMDKHLRIGKGVSFTQAFKPVAAQLNIPQFLIGGDSVQLIGKALNHTSDDYSITTKFSINDKVVNTQQSTVQSHASNISSLPILVSEGDTLKASFFLTTTTDFNDGEERKIPVFKKGSEETEGAFYVVQGDTSVSFTPKLNGDPVYLFAQNNTLDLLLEELQHLKQYPFYCMEQTASKLKGLLMERKIMQALKKDFKNEKDVTILLKKLQDAQLFEGAWSWWEKGKPDVYITSYIVDALLQIKNDPLVETNIRNGLLYLQNQLPYLKKDALLMALNTMSNAGHIIDYKPYTNKIKFDSLTQHQQWQWVQIMQKQGLDYKTQLNKLVNEATPTMLGGLHWGSENYLWYSNHVATSVIAFQVLEKEKEYQSLLPKIIQYFLEQKRNGYYRNTVESSSIVSTILPKILQTNEQFNQPASVRITGDTSFAITSFPYKIKLIDKNSPITLRKSGGGLTYITLYQKWWNNKPQPVTDRFSVSTQFERNRQQIITIPAGEKLKMIVKINVIADADYVMVEIPIPAGCNYGGKKQDVLGMHKEYFKNKVVLFVETLTKGNHTFDIDLEPRYKGTYTLNPAKAELMYFPTFYGRNEMRKVEIQ